MLTVRCPVHFPQLVFVKEIEFPASGCKTPLYKLDWTKFNEHHIQKHEEWSKRSGRDIAMGDCVPNNVGLLVDNCHYVLDNKHLNEINRCFRQAFEEWQTQKPFDSVIYSMTMEIQKAYLYVGFKLLCDCMFNVNTQYYDRTVLRRIAPHAMLVRFWQRYVGSGLIEEYSRFDKLSLPPGKTPSVDDLAIEAFKKDVATTIKQYESYREESLTEVAFTPEKEEINALSKKEQENLILHLHDSGRISTNTMYSQLGIQSPIHGSKLSKRKYRS